MIISESRAGGAELNRAWMPTAADTLTIVAGAIAIIGAGPIGWLVRGAVGFGTSGAIEIPIARVAIPLFAIGVVAVIGGISAIRRRNWRWALAGSVCAVVFFPLGLPAIVLLSLSKTEFR